MTLIQLEQEEAQLLILKMMVFSKWGQLVQEQFLVQHVIILGGVQPTVSDANLILGRLPENLVGGRMKLNKQKAINSVKQISKN